MKYYCDTNFIIRYLLADDKEMFAKTKDIFAKTQNGEITLIIEQAIFTETIFVLSSFYKVPKANIIQVLGKLLAYKGITTTDKDTFLAALEIYNHHSIHIVDCLLIAKAKLNGLAVMSFDKKLHSLLASMASN